MDRPIVAVDTMGGDNAPEAPVRGAFEAARSLGARVCLVGDEARIRQFMGDPDLQRAGLVTIRHAPGVIEAGDQPVAAIRRKKDSSMVVALNMAAAGEAAAVVSAGNTGALMAGGVLFVGRLEGVDRPAISTVLPTQEGSGVLLLDAGANTDVRPDHLAQFAAMGATYVERVLGWKPARVALLNIGTEESKGNEAARQAYGLLKTRSDFAGNIEARDVLSGSVNVVVCDGFAGNVFLKTIEGVVEMIFSGLKAEVTRDLLSKAGAALLRPAFRRLKGRLDYSEYGGAPLLGLKKACIKCHGSSGSRAIMNGIRVAVEFSRSGAIEALAAELAGSA
ncbi:MAG: phosphate acyltransferase PlsX [Firmicutes bacterium]|nr:phosphate acyltransferase PlsX [Bacillota bacterium]